jgi:D-3-phosphoglycerate dehydrogenase / 2-oxoglutarate reductase
MPTVLLSAPYMLPYVERFKPVFLHYGLDLIIPQVQERLTQNEIIVYVNQFDATLCGDDQYTKNVLDACSTRLKVISKWGTGLDSIDRDEAAKLGIKVFNTPNAFTLPVADSVMGYMLAFARQIPWMDKAMKNGRWKKIPGRSLSECTLGVVGVGNVGKAVIRRARAFGMKILGNDIIPIAPDFLIENGVEMTLLSDLMARSDYISINCDLNIGSFHLINESMLKLVKRGAVIVNTARGRIIDELAMIEALKDGRLAGAGLDVYETEPMMSNNPLLQMDNVLLAPHNSNSSPSAWERVHWNSIRNLLDGLGIQSRDLMEVAASLAAVRS